MGLFPFSSGVAVARIPIAGTSLTKGRKMPTLQEASLKFDGSIKEMFGANAYAEDSAGGSRKITGSLKMGQVKAGQLAEIFFGATPATGHPVVVIDDGGVAGLVPSSNTVNTHASITDMGVDSAVDGLPFDRVAASPAAGQYSVVESTGVYTFAAGDARAAAVRPSYRYTDSSTGKTYEMGNPILGTLADFELTLLKPRFTKNMGILIYHAVATSLDMSNKREEYMEPAVNFSVFIDAAKASPGQVWSTDPD